MKVLLLLCRTDLTETPAETAIRRGKALREHNQRAKYEAGLQVELAAIEALRQPMREPVKPRRWAIAAE